MRKVVFLPGNSELEAIEGERWISLLTGSDEKKRRQNVLTDFAPLAAVRGERDLDDPDLMDEIRQYREQEIDLLISTDVLSEGQNLQERSI